MRTRNFRELLDAMPADRRQRVEDNYQATLAAMPAEDLRRARQMALVRLSDSVNGWPVEELPVVGAESAMPVNVLAEYVGALGGRLELRAVFPERAFLIGPFESASR